MQRRLFLAIDIPESAKIQLWRKTEPWRRAPILWGKYENFHMTVVFLGHRDDEDLPDLFERVRGCVEATEAFEVMLDRVSLMPSIENPRMVWASGESSGQLKNLQEVVEKELGIFSRDRKEPIPHITLGRIRQGKWKQVENHPDISLPIRMPISVSTLTLFESALENGKRVYIPMETFDLGGEG